MAGCPRVPELPAAHIEIVEPAPEDCPSNALPPEGNVKLRNYRMLSESLRAYTPTGDVHTSPAKGKLVARFDVCATISPPRQRILELLRPEDPGREALEAIVRPAPRRGLARPLDDDTRRFLQRALLSPSPQCLSNAATPEPYSHERCASVDSCCDNLRTEMNEEADLDTSSSCAEATEKKGSARSLADELREAEEEERSGSNPRRETRWHGGGGGAGVGANEACERERLGRLALSVEEDEAEGSCSGLSLAARRLDALLAESRGLHAELAGIHQDMQAACARACRCAEAARALQAESLALRYLDDVVALLRGDVAAASRARHWPFALGQGSRQHGRNYVV